MRIGSNISIYRCPSRRWRSMAARSRTVTTYASRPLTETIAVENRRCAPRSPGGRIRSRRRRREDCERRSRDRGVAARGSRDRSSDSRPPRQISRYRGRVDASRASSLAGLKEAVGGTVRVDATVKGPIATPALAGRISASALSFRNLRDVELSTYASYDIREKRTAFSSLDVRAPWGRVAGDGVLAMADTGESRLTATLTGYRRRDADAGAGWRVHRGEPHRWTR